MKRILVLLLMAATMLAVPASVFAVEAEADSVVIEQPQNETKPSFKFGRGFKKPTFDGTKKPAALPEGCEKPDMSKIKENGFGKFRGFDKETIREKLDEMLAEGKITQEKYDAIISGECKPSFDGKKIPVFPNKKADTQNDETTAKARPTLGKRTGGKFPAMKKGFPFAGAKG